MGEGCGGMGLCVCCGGVCGVVWVEEWCGVFIRKVGGKGVVGGKFKVCWM